MDTQLATPLIGLLTLHTTTNDEIKNITYNVPSDQTIYLRGYRIELGSAANALAEKVLYLELPIYNVSKMLDANQGFTYLPILLDNAAVTHTYGMDLPISLGRDLQPEFRMRILNGTFTPVANLVSATFQFSLHSVSL